MATWATTTENSASWTSEADSLVANTGEPIGLLLALTHAAPTTLSWTNTTENSASWADITEN